MRTLLLHITLLFILISCKSSIVNKPVWLNVSSTIQMPDGTLQFSSSIKKWNATLQCFSQPVPLQIAYSDSGFFVRLLNKEGIIEGPAQIILNYGSQYFYYDVMLANCVSIATQKDYRSPKTVNPDSGLQQQQILHKIDVNRNIVSEDNNYFKESNITLSPKAGTFRAIAAEPLSSYYVQPGSCVTINIKSTYDKVKELHTVTAGPLKDKYNNTVADGTLIAFLYSNDEYAYRMEATLLDGTATVYIPANRKPHYLFAKVNETSSNKIKLMP